MMKIFVHGRGSRKAPLLLGEGFGEGSDPTPRKPTVSLISG